jgi:hypothetical protein
LPVNQHIFKGCPECKENHRFFNKLENLVRYSDGYLLHIAMKNGRFSGPPTLSLNGWQKVVKRSGAVFTRRVSAVIEP